MTKNEEKNTHNEIMKIYLYSFSCDIRKILERNMYDLPIQVTIHLNSASQIFQFDTLVHLTEENLI